MFVTSNVTNFGTITLVPVFSEGRLALCRTGFALGHSALDTVSIDRTRKKGGTEAAFPSMGHSIALITRSWHQRKQKRLLHRPR